MVQFASYLRRVLCKTRLIFPRINGPNVTPVTIDLHKSKLYVKTKQKFSKDINSLASKVDKRQIVEVNGEWKLY